MKSIGSLFLALVMVGALTALVFALAGRSEAVLQPIRFNHTVHIDSAGLECVDCHTDAQTSVFAGLPGKSICLDCHDVDDESGTHAEKDKLFAFDEVDHDIPWKRVAVTRPDVYFSHRRHVTAGKLDCLRCHPDQPSLDRPPPTRRIVMTMTECIDCHEENKVSSDCLACHR